jgi:hypothetical protein
VNIRVVQFISYSKQYNNSYLAVGHTSCQKILGSLRLFHLCHFRGNRSFADYVIIMIIIAIITIIIVVVSCFFTIFSLLLYILKHLDIWLSRVKHCLWRRPMIIWTCPKYKTSSQLLKDGITLNAFGKTSPTYIVTIIFSDIGIHFHNFGRQIEWKYRYLYL